MKDTGRYMHGMFMGQTLLNPFSMLMFPSMGNREKFTGHEGVNNGAEKNKSSDEIERFLLEAVTGQLFIAVLIARLVGMHISRSGTDNANGE